VLAWLSVSLERGANDLHMVQQMPLPPHHLLLQQNPEWFILLVPAYPGCPGKRAVKRLCVFIVLNIVFVDYWIHADLSHSNYGEKTVQL